MLGENTDKIKVLLLFMFFSLLMSFADFWEKRSLWYKR